MANGERHIDKHESKNDEVPSLGGLGGDLLSQPQKGADKVANLPEGDKTTVKDQVATKLDAADINQQVGAKVDEKMAMLGRSNPGEANGLELLKAKNSAGDTVVDDWKKQFKNIDASVWAKFEK